MFRYFGYGSNLRRESLRSKGVEIVHAEPAVLHGWRLVFNIPHPLRMEGRVASIVPDPAGEVHGALCTFAADYLAPLDRHEGEGEFYARREMTVRSYAGALHPAFVYVGLPRRTGEEGAPSRRYRNILVAGARTIGLTPEYIAWLEAHAAQPLPECPPFAPPIDSGRRFTWAEFSSAALHTAVLGHVFDMRHASDAHIILRTLIDGRDATAFFLRRMDSASGDEHTDGRVYGPLTAAQKRYLNAVLHELAHTYDYAGQLAPGEPGTGWV